MSTKKSVFLSTQTTKWIELTTKNDIHDQGAKWSESINATFDQFRYLIKTELPELDQEEWEAILNVYAGCYFPAHGIPARIASDMLDNAGAIDISELSPNHAELVKKIYGMSQVQQLAILYFVQIFWSSTRTGDWEDIYSEITKF